MMVQCCHVSKCRRLRCSDVDLTHENPALFISSQIPCKASKVLVITWHSIWCIFFTSLLFVDVFHYWQADRRHWLLAFENWGYILCIVTTGMETTVRLVAVMSRQKDSDVSGSLRWYQKVQWVFYNMNNVITVLITILYFSLYKIDFTFGVITKHLLTSVYVILNVSVISSIPSKILHLYHPAIFTLVYAIFISIFQSQNNTHVYLILDWDKPTNAAVTLVITVLLGIPTLHILLYGIYRLRIQMLSKLSKKKDFSEAPPASVVRDITATDVVLEHSGGCVEFIDLKPDCKDDLSLKPSSSFNGDVFSRHNKRLFRSETDLRDYRIKNGLYCDFAKSSLILHPKRKSTSDIFGDDAPSLVNHVDKTSESKGSQIIVVKKCETCENNNEESDTEPSSSECESSASSDYLSQYITEDILAYL